MCTAYPSPADETVSWQQNSWKSLLPFQTLGGPWQHAQLLSAQAYGKSRLLFIFHRHQEGTSATAVSFLLIKIRTRKALGFRNIFSEQSLCDLGHKVSPAVHFSFHHIPSSAFDFHVTLAPQSLLCIWPFSSFPFFNKLLKWVTTGTEP